MYVDLKIKYGDEIQRDYDELGMHLKAIQRLCSEIDRKAKLSPVLIISTGGATQEEQGTTA